jgi:hypothetical protein
MNIAIASRFAGLAAFFVALAFFIAGVAGVAPAHASPVRSVATSVPNCGEWSHPTLISPTQWGCSQAEDAAHRHRETRNHKH